MRYCAGLPALPSAWATNVIAWLSAWATGGLRPDLVVLMDIDPVTGLGRVADRCSADRLESEHVEFHERVRYAFLDLAASDPKRYLVVNGAAPPEEIAREVLARVRTLLPTGTPTDGLVGGGSSPGRAEAVPAVPPPPIDPRHRTAEHNGVHTDGARLVRRVAPEPSTPDTPRHG